MERVEAVSGIISRAEIGAVTKAEIQVQEIFTADIGTGEGEEDGTKI